MFAYFHNHKFFSDNKGQLAPLFIIIIVVLLIMALVTINLSKVSSIKTDSSNASDAAALAGGSVMANLFNNTAKASSDMDAAYQEFSLAADILFAIATTTLALIELKSVASAAQGKLATPDVGSETCKSVPKITAVAVLELLVKNLVEELFASTVMAIITGTTAYSIRAYYHYQIIREMADDARNSALKLSYQFAFINSGIGGKLKEGDPPPEVTNPEEKRNYRNEFSKFTDQFSEDDMQPDTEYTYSWKDGQKREHSVKVKADIDEVKKYKLRITNLPWGAVVGLLMVATNVAVSFLYETACALAMVACAFWNCKEHANFPPVKAICAVIWAILAAVTYVLLIASWVANLIFIETLGALVWPAVLGAWAGIKPNGVHTDDSGDMFWATLCKIEDIVHDRKVRVDVWMSHEGADLGLWQTKYPQTHSYTVVDFSGEGDIGKFNFNFDPSIIETDTIGSAAPVAVTP